MKPLVIHGTIGSFVQFMKDVPEEFILQVNLTCATDAIITLQSSYIREVLLLETSRGLHHTRTVCIHHTSVPGRLIIHRFLIGILKSSFLCTMEDN